MRWIKAKNSPQASDDPQTNETGHQPKSRLGLVFLLTFLISLGLLVLAGGFYMYRPGLVRRSVSHFSMLMLPSSPYNTPHGVHPYLHTKVERMLVDARSQGIDLRVVEGYRSKEKQLLYYSRGRLSKGGIITNAPPGLSYHNHGWAVDVCEFKDGKPYWASDRWDEIGAIGKKHGLVWGGDWKRLVDRPHFQLSQSDILRHVLF